MRKHLQGNNAGIYGQGDADGKPWFEVPLANQGQHACIAAMDALRGQLDNDALAQRYMHDLPLFFQMPDGTDLDVLEFFALVETHGRRAVPALRRLVEALLAQPQLQVWAEHGSCLSAVFKALAVLDPTALRLIRRYPWELDNGPTLAEDALPALIEAHGWDDERVEFVLDALLTNDTTLDGLLYWRELGLGRVVAQRYTPQAFATRMAEAYGEQGSNAGEMAEALAPLTPWEFEMFSLLAAEADDDGEAAAALAGLQPPVSGHRDNGGFRPVRTSRGSETTAASQRTDMATALLEAARDPMTFPVAATLSLITTAITWIAGYSLLGMAFCSSVVLIGSYLWNVYEWLLKARAAQRADEDGPVAALAIDCAARLRSSGAQILVLAIGSALLFAIAKQKLNVGWGSIVVAVCGLAITVHTLHGQWREVVDECGEAVISAWKRHLTAMLGIAAMTGAGCVAATIWIPKIGKDWPKVIAFGINPKTLAIMALYLVLAALAMGLNRWLAAGAARDSADRDLGRTYS